MKRRADFNVIIYIALALLAGLGVGLAYSWLISPVTYTDANPALLRVDFKDQYRAVVAASYAATHDLPRARARLQLLGDADLIGELSAQAQRMLAAGEPFENAQPLAQLAADLQQGFASIQATNPPANPPATELANSLATETPIIPTLPLTETSFPEIATAEPTLVFEQTPLIPQNPLVTASPRPTVTTQPGISKPFTLVGQDTVCDPSLKNGLLQVILMDNRRKQPSGMEIIVTWDQGEDRFFTGFKPELGNGYADFIMQAETIYSVRIVEGGSFIPNIAAPTCTAADGSAYLGGLLLTFQQS
ncbi:MAG: hypothetical protein IT310_00650 [Anaerolineales bacterium]|nr:hypothetical protein [Anaerolineales bacterium]